ncbi:FecR domain-containing protein [Ensifer sp. 2YAB10]|uniref:FecR family protein n=1 Tax=unclassified Ensifer TaxID=2633371 RepID=UPI001A5B71D0|nr:FecR domain-containing protein [Ensifer sp. SSB1]MBK5565607.1 FecR domain-containing protein [Ensifer sp. SSB1]
MFCLRGAALIALCAVTFSPTIAAEPVGQAVEIRTAVSGARGAIAVKDPVYRDERISTSKSGLGQFVFQDGTKLAVGWGSSVVIDKFVYDDAKSVKKLTIMAAKGTFRWISGKSGHSAYQIVTPAGTIGVRGTAFDFYVGRDGTTAVVLLSGAASFCGAGGCRQLTQRCDCVVAKPGGGISDPRRVSRNTLKSLGNAKALPFLSGGQRLSGALGWAGGGCSLAAAINEDVEPKPKTVQPPAVEQEKPRQQKPPLIPGTQRQEQRQRQEQNGQGQRQSQEQRQRQEQGQGGQKQSQSQSQRQEQAQGQGGQQQSQSQSQRQEQSQEGGGTQRQEQSQSQSQSQSQN